MSAPHNRPHLFAALSEQNIKNCIICDKKTRNRMGSVIGSSLYYYRLCKACENEYFADCGNIFSQAIRLRNAIVIVEEGEISLKDAFNIILARFNLLEKDSKIALRYMRRALKTENSGYCRICNQITDDKISGSNSNYFVCDDCNTKYLFMYTNSNVKVDVLKAAIELSQREQIALPYALNIENGLYSLEEARARIVRDKQESRISASDIFVRGRRLPGSFESGK